MLYSTSRVPAHARGFKIMSVQRLRPFLLSLSLLVPGALALTPSATVQAAPVFDDALPNLGNQACGGGGCWTNYLRVTDLDADDDLDIVFVNYAGFFTMGSAQPLVTMVNNGDGAFIDHSDTIVGGHWGRIRQVAIGDVDGDGFPDMVAPNGWGGDNALFMNNGDGTFVDEGADRLPPDASVFAGGVRLGDVDDDGDLDIFIGDGYAQGMGHPTPGALWLNDGAGMFEDASAGLPTDKQGFDPDDVDFLDVDRDFDLDIVINMHAGKSSLWLNDGAGGFSDATDQLADMPMMGYHYNMSPCDVDGDGDLDLWIDNMGPGYTEQLMINDGSGSFTDETEARVSGNPGSDDNGVLCVDLDDDGDLDGVVLALNFGQATPERALINDGDGNFTYEADMFPAIEDPTLWGEFGDLNGDGKLDLVTGQGEGNPELNRVYFGNAELPADTRPPSFPAIETFDSVDPGEPLWLHFSIVDSTITDEGPRLDDVSVEVEHDGEPVEQVAGWFMGGDLFRAELPAAGPGVMVTYRVCAADLAGNSGCSEDSSYTVNDDEPGTTSDTDATDSGTTDTTDTSETSNTATDTSAGPATDAGTGETSVPDDDDDDDDTDDTDSGEGSGGETVEGCGCQSDAPAPSGLLALAGLGLLGLRRRRR